ncbi:MAG TPA: diacylglycerol kinase family protein [Cytophagaceae bacterium]
MMKTTAPEKILFIINPISGGKKKEHLPELIKQYLDPKKFIPEIRFTERGGHATVLAREALTNGYSFIVAAGGDGTINETARELINTHAVLGIIPFGSGNGLARHMRIPLNTIKAIQLINQMNVVSIDTGYINNHYFFCTAGVGFDAHIGHAFANAGTRGFKTYFKISVKEFFNYKPHRYRLTCNGEEREENAFLITFANTSQYGNNALIAPLADVQDELLDVCILSKFPSVYALDLGRRLFSGTMNKSRYMRVVKTKEITVVRDQAGPVHVDGEPIEMGEKLHVAVVPSSLKVLVGEHKTTVNS